MQGFRQQQNGLLWEGNHETVQIEPWGRDSLGVLTTHAKRRLPIPANDGPEGKRIGMWLEGETPTD